VEFPNVMEQRYPLDAALRTLVETGGLGEDERISSDAAYVRTSGFVVGVDRVQQRLERSRAQSLGLRAKVVLAVEQAAGGGDGG
jgi:hypothetical protein